MNNLTIQSGVVTRCTFSDSQIIQTLSITKVATEQSYDSVGDVINYTITATNTGNVAQNLTVSDPNVSNLVCTPSNGSSVAPGASMTCTASHTITQADIDAGSYLNTSCVDATGATQACAGEDVPAVQTPALSIEKTVTGVDADTTPPFSVDAAGDVISYSILVTNTGNQTLTGVSVSDPRITNLDCDPSTGNQTTGFVLAPGATLTCTGTYTVLQSDLDGNGGGDGDIDNTATADSIQTEPVTDSAAVPLGQSAALSIEKTVTGVDADTTPPFAVDAAGDVISYSILVTNIGNQTLTGVAVSDPRIANLDCDPSTGNQTTGFALAPGATLTCTGTYTVTQADLDGNGGGDGDIDNTATADSNETGPASDSAAVPLAQSPALTIAKTVSPSLVTRRRRSWSIRRGT